MSAADPTAPAPEVRSLDLIADIARTADDSPMARDLARGILDHRTHTTTPDPACWRCGAEIVAGRGRHRNP